MPFQVRLLSSFAAVCACATPAAANEDSNRQARMGVIFEIPISLRADAAPIPDCTAAAGG
jgi:hypothetical protein